MTHYHTHAVSAKDTHNLYFYLTADGILAKGYTGPVDGKSTEEVMEGDGPLVSGVIIQAWQPSVSTEAPQQVILMFDSRADQSDLALTLFLHGICPDRQLEFTKLFSNFVNADHDCEGHDMELDIVVEMEEDGE